MSSSSRLVPFLEIGLGQKLLGSEVTQSLAGTFGIVSAFPALDDFAGSTVPGIAFLRHADLDAMIAQLLRVLEILIVAAPELTS
jgi:hypothetical protein